MEIEIYMIAPGFSLLHYYYYALKYNITLLKKKKKVIITGFEKRKKMTLSQISPRPYNMLSQKRHMIHVLKSRTDEDRDKEKSKSTINY